MIRSRSTLERGLLIHLSRVSRTLSAFVVASLSYATAAQAESAIAGTVVSAETNMPLADVVVTATSPSIQGEQVVVTDAEGHYRIPELPPGLYTLRFDKESFRPLSRSELQVAPERSVQADVALISEEIQPEIFGCGPPLIDTGSTTTGVRLYPEFIQTLAVNPPTGNGGAARSFDSLAELAPGAQSGAYGVSINGATAFENAYRVDGFSTQDPVLGVNASPLSVEFIQDVEVITGGYMPEYGRASGGIIRAETRYGSSNAFHGSVFGNWVPGALVGTPTPVSRPASALSGQNALENLGNFGATLGGPIVRDKLWFFAGVAPVLSRVEHTRTLQALAHDARPTPIPGTSRTFFADERGLQALGKLTYLFNQDHNVSLSVITTPTRSGGDGRLTVDPLTGGVQELVDSHPDASGLVQLDSNFTTAGLEYRGALMEKQLLLEANLGWSRQTLSRLPVDGSGDALGTPEGDAEVLSGNGLAGRSRVTYRMKRPVGLLENVPDAALFCGTSSAEQTLFCPVQDYDIGGIGQMFINTVDRYQANARATLLLNILGNHVMKAGVDADLVSYEQIRASSGGVRFVESTDGSLWRDTDRHGYLSGPDAPVTLGSDTLRSRSMTLGGFVQDSWNFAQRFTVNAGVRYDMQSLYGNDGEPALVLGNQLSPRVGLIVDPLANGRMKLFAHYAKYHAQIPLAVLDRIAPAEHRYSAFRAAQRPDGTTGCDPSTLEGQRTGCSDPANVVPLEPGGEDALYSYRVPEKQFIDPLLAPQSSSELVTGAELEVLNNVRLSATYTHRNLDSALEDMSRDGGNSFFLGNPGSGAAAEFPKAERTYDAATVALSHEFVTYGWLAEASYTWSRLYGNYLGLVQARAGQQAPSILTDFEIPSMMENRTGLLPEDRTHSIKVFGAKEFQLTHGLRASIGLSYRGFSGTPINYLGGHPLLGTGETFLLPRGSAERTPWLHSIDSHIGVTWQLKRQEVSLTLDVFNLFNFQEVTRVDENYTYAAVLPLTKAVEAGQLTPDMITTSEGSRLTESQLNRSFKQPLQYQTPRQVRLGLRYAF
ncbi:TonB-dependent receptor [Vitiosangium sp. GDMCC 1.1324]|uniref:TonB-dependent receptor n=1 Tax=Vitiosangium sp. (strain GDMCC 1.1324) TaxID=2138576 RepID=UPI000D3AB02D|nr:TonB-dependent receptor [Vitiosangium sp. GDMCC 1.1324]PTL77543.1 TonB-dependent receptor [Vitiosangium sp. GDMCC 1.1324]